MGGIAGAGASGCGISLMSDSVVSTIAATLEAFSIAALVTFGGSMIPLSSSFPYSPVSAS